MKIQWLEQSTEQFCGKLLVTETIYQQYCRLWTIFNETQLVY